MAILDFFVTEKNGRCWEIISELKIRRQRDSTTADLVEEAWGEVAVAMAREIALRKLARRRVVVAPFPVEV